MQWRGYLVTCIDSCSLFCPHEYLGILHGSVVRCLTCNPGVLGSSHTGSSEFFNEYYTLYFIAPESQTTRTRYRLCNNPTPFGGGQDCPGNAEQTDACLKDCPGW